MELEDFVIETTVYEIFCSNCGSRTDEQESPELAVADATDSGFEIQGDEVLCYACAD